RLLRRARRAAMGGRYRGRELHRQAIRCEGPRATGPRAAPGDRLTDLRSRLSGTLNEDFSLLALRGAVAQLGERMNRTHEVRGSIPLSSTGPAYPRDSCSRRRRERPEGT